MTERTITRTANPPEPTEQEQKWTAAIRDHLKGRKIVDARYQTEAEAEAMGWDHARGVILYLDDGAQLIPSQDDEGNGPGAIFTNYKELATIPVF